MLPAHLHDVLKLHLQALLLLLGSGILVGELLEVVAQLEQLGLEVQVGRLGLLLLRLHALQARVFLGQLLVKRALLGCCPGKAWDIACV